jgi:23S rRNA (adenine2503-C2)-methyltransferase
MPPISLYDLTRSDLGQLVAQWGFPAASASRVWRGLYRDGADTIAALDVPARLRERLEADTTLTGLTEANRTQADDGLTEKYLLELADGRQIETVLMRYPDRATACVSSQAGCALGCVFCATGQMGFGRNLTTGEIVSQALFAQRALARAAPHERLRNIVLMGMGEPLLNYDAVLRACDILRDPGGLAIAGKRITLSTVGVVPGIVRLADERQPVSLAVSLHAATQAARLALVPTAGAWPLDELIAACRYYTARLDRRIFFEWTLIAGENDSDEQADTLAHLLQGIPAQINLIPLNPTAGYDAAAATDHAARRFQTILREHGLPVTLRQRRGIAISAGCGQLAAAGA